MARSSRNTDGITAKGKERDIVLSTPSRTNSFLPHQWFYSTCGEIVAPRVCGWPGTLYIGKVLQLRSTDPAATRFSLKWIRLGKAHQVPAATCLLYLAGRVMYQARSSAVMFDAAQ